MSKPCLVLQKSSRKGSVFLYTTREEDPRLGTRKKEHALKMSLAAITIAFPRREIGLYQLSPSSLAAGSPYSSS